MIATESTRVRRETLSTPLGYDTLSAGVVSEAFGPTKAMGHAPAPRGGR